VLFLTLILSIPANFSAVAKRFD